MTTKCSMVSWMGSWNKDTREKLENPGRARQLTPVIPVSSHPDYHLALSVFFSHSGRCVVVSCGFISLFVCFEAGSHSVSNAEVQWRDHKAYCSLHL